MSKFKKQSYYPVDLRERIIYNVPCKTKEEIEGRSKTALPLFLAKKGNELLKKAHFEMEFEIRNEKAYDKARGKKLRKKDVTVGKKLHNKKAAKKAFDSTTFDLPKVKRKKKC